jgi:hypothetical protein
MAESGSTGSSVRDAGSSEFASAGEAFAALDALGAQVVERLRRIEKSVPSARTFAVSLERDLEEHRRERDALRLRLGLGPADTFRENVDDPLDLEALRAAQEKLTYAHAEALLTLGDAAAVRALARHMVDLSRHLTLLGLWIEAEERRV